MSNAFLLSKQTISANYNQVICVIKVILSTTKFFAPFHGAKNQVN